MNNRLVAELRRSLELDGHEVSDEELLRGTEDTFCRAAAELRLAFADLRAELARAFPSATRFVRWLSGA